MISDHQPDRFAVSGALARATGVAFAIAVPLAVLLVGAANLWTCFAPSARAGSGIDPSQLYPVDRSRDTHQTLVSALGDVWDVAGRADSFSLVIVGSQDVNAASVGRGRFLAWEGVATLSPWVIRGIMAHEVAHDVLRHSRKAAELRDVADALGRTLSVLGGANEPEVDRTVQRWARNVVLPRYSRLQEYQADSLGAVLLGELGFHGPRAMAASLQVLLDRYGNTEGGFFDYHPSTRERIAALAGQATITDPSPRIVLAGTAMNLGYARNPTVGTSAWIQLRLGGVDDLQGWLEVLPPLYGSGDARLELWADSALLVSSSPAGDTIAWFGILREGRISGAYLVSRGPYKGQGGHWEVEQLGGPGIEPRFGRGRPFAANVRIAEYFSPFMR